MPVESGPSQEEEILDKDVEREGNPEAEDNSEVRDACSPELFCTLEEASQSQLSELGKAQPGEEAPDMTLGAHLPSLLLVAERLCRKQPQRTKEDFLHDVMMHCGAEKRELKEWRDSKKRDQKENAAHQNEATETLKRYGAPSRHTPGANSTLNRAAPHLPSPAATVAKLFSMCPPDTANTLINFLAPLCTCCILLLPHHSLTLTTPSTHYTQHPSLCSLALLKYRIHCTVFQWRRSGILNCYERRKVILLSPFWTRLAFAAVVTADSNIGKIEKQGIF
ncbi:hypothetical protein UY3_12313 [Chelonia mydas]|uniref:Uncharacterized protein n=1 Tax=Chelonia mydas TaxID=8469 RepID=M7BEJ7_CHEMY|nr:hypothetical protein UY3_12313 [Chelonia mydas]